jgi:hypothetical protein
MPIHQFNGWQFYVKQSCRLHQCHSSSWCSFHFIHSSHCEQD